MQYPALLVADTHLTDNPRDEYRWALFPWLAQTCKEEKVKTLVWLGDLTDAKDNHSSRLANRVVAGMQSIVVAEKKILVGNHDWLLSGQEYFRFLSVLPGVQYITAPCEDPDVSGQPTFYLPFSKNPARDWRGLDLSHYRYVFMHQTVRGALSSNGERMDGEELPDLSAAGKVYSGDIHVPQVCGAVEYVGSPYHVHFGDRFTPRCVLLERGGRAVDLHFDAPSRVTVAVPSLRELQRQRFRPGDQVKLRVSLGESEKHEWQRVRRECAAWLRESGAEVCGVELVLEKRTRRVRVEGFGRQAAEPAAASPSEAVYRFVRDEELGATALDVALELMG